MPSPGFLLGTTARIVFGVRRILVVARRRSDVVHVVSARLGDASAIVTITVQRPFSQAVSVKPLTCSRAWSGRREHDRKTASIRPASAGRNVADCNAAACGNVVSEGDYVNGTDDRDGMACRISCGYRWTADDPGWRAQVLPTTPA